MLHEVLLALLGHPGSIIQEQEQTIHGSSQQRSRYQNTNGTTTFYVPEGISFLTPTEREAINRVVGLGRTYRDLRRFVRPLPLKWTTANGGGGEWNGVEPGQQPRAGLRAECPGCGLYVRAMKLGVEELLDEYAARVAEVERDVMADPTLTLARVHAGVREVRATISSAITVQIAATIR